MTLEEHRELGLTLARIRDDLELTVFPRRRRPGVPFTRLARYINMARGYFEQELLRSRLLPDTYHQLHVYFPGPDRLPVRITRASAKEPDALSRWAAALLTELQELSARYGGTASRMLPRRGRGCCLG